MENLEKPLNLKKKSNFQVLEKLWKIFLLHVYVRAHAAGLVFMGTVA